MIAISIDMTCYDNRPIEELQRLIRQRMLILGESTRDAVIATAITALKSLRAETRVFKGKVKVAYGGSAADGIRYALCPGFYTSFSKEGRCVRQGVKAIGRREASGQCVKLPHCVQLVEPGKRAWLSASVFMVTLSDEVHKRWNKQPKTFYVIAETVKAAESYLQKRFSNIAKRFQGAARYAMTEAMRTLSTRNAPDEKGTSEKRLGPSAKRVAMENIHVFSFGTPGQGQWTVEVNDNLSYASFALKSGTSGVTFALMKAANSVSGYLRGKAVDVFDPDIATPFPEIAKGGSMR